MTNSSDATAQAGKRERLAAAAARVFHEQGVEKTTIADIARSAEVPVGNVYYYFKTKDQLVEAAISAQRRGLRDLIARLEQHEAPQDRLKALVRTWVDQRDVAAQFGCPTGTLAAELGKRADGLDREAAAALRELIDWVERQFAGMRSGDADELAVALIAAYQGISLLTNTFHEPELMVAEGRRLERWIDSLVS
ncbi:TetR/AcrR family transcriptional regulator [Nocardia sp. NBC_00508]|uniref:TetR/AcrR family transcriptional regulator n=1 Tax=Nocardia sp. NBC_00508 TaxID=2975992 RepID=UPI002E804CCC|nr:TetR/AcrR family transcriptional regulator [Nocardia sp. NBC_00508]WUD65413.1 TetR/AcrR family transcriptional regulator [Nocardia sp. NBC_00508]